MTVPESIPLFLSILFVGIYAQCKSVQTDVAVPEIVNNNIELKIKPSITDTTIVAADDAHLIMYDASIPQGKLFLFLPGTNGIPERGPKALFQAAIEQGYRVINLSYINKQAVARICKGENLAADIDCTEKFRTQRVFGTQTTTLIPDEPQDAIIPRLTKLLIYLHETDKAGNWDKYLDQDKPDWSKITVTGQSQGGGMSAFIAQRVLVNRVVTFSGGWDFSEINKPRKNKIAKWYSTKSITPPERWYGTYHTLEPMASIIAETYKALAIPENHTYAFDLPVQEGRKAHSQAIRNIVYKDYWVTILGDGGFQ